MISPNSRPSKTHRMVETGPGSRTCSASKIRSNDKSGGNLEKAGKQLGALSDRKLLSDLENLNHREHKLKTLVLLYLAEIDKRQLYLPMGYGSLFDFCTMHLGYTRATAGRRIRAARAASKYPEALDMLRSGGINITTLSMISDVLDRDNYVAMLAEIRNKSTRYVEMLVSRHRPVPVIRDTVRPVCVRRRIETSPVSLAPGSSAGTTPADLDGSSAPAAGTGGPNPSSTVDTGSRKSNKTSSRHNDFGYKKRLTSFIAEG